MNGQPLSRLDDDALTRLRRDHIGIVYQFFHLLPTLNVRENVALPLLLAGRPERDVLAAADALLAEVGARPAGARAAAHAFGRRAAARGGGASAGSRALARAGRRADRESRQPLGGAGGGADGGTRTPSRRHGAHGDAQPRRRRGRRSRDHALGRAHGLRRAHRRRGGPGEARRGRFPGAGPAVIALVRWLLLRRLARQPGRTLLMVLGVALGVAMVVAIRLASDSALASFGDTVDAVAGRANLCVSAAADGFDERLFARIRRTPGVLAAAPVVEVNALVGRLLPADTDPGVELGARRGFDETLLVLGLDPFSEAPFGRLADLPVRQSSAAR